jgi:hypothetical protein
LYQSWALHLKRLKRKECKKKWKEEQRHRIKEINKHSQKPWKIQGLDSRVSQGLWLELVGPFIFYYKFLKEDYSPNFCQKQVTQATKELESGASKEIENGWKEGHRNTNKEK